MWTAACTARGTDLRGKSLINLDVLTPVPQGFIAKLGSKLRPAGIEHGFGQAGSGQSVRIDIADADAPVLAHEPRGQLVQEMLATVRNLRVDGPHPRLASGALCSGERPLEPAVDSWGLDLLTRRQRDQRFEAEVDADLTGPMLPVFADINLQIQVPVAAGILREAAAEDLPPDRTAQPEPVSPPKEDHCIVPQSNGPRAWKGIHPKDLLARHRGRLPQASREIANCLQTACTVSE